MDTRDAYNQWSVTYDEVENETRDLEKKVLQKTLSTFDFGLVIEIGCGTGKNTVWIAQKAKWLIAVDFSEKMLEIAKGKITSPKVTFTQADITTPWNFSPAPAELVTCSLILEHISNIDFVFEQAFKLLKPEGKFYVCELHPFKQYSGSKARFERDGKTYMPDCFVHHLSDYINAATHHGFKLRVLEEWFDNDDRSATPRLASFLFEKP